MHLLDTKVTKNERTERARAVMEVIAPKSNDRSSAAPILVCKGRHLDVDAVLTRSLPNPGAFSASDVKTIVLR
ncbi:MAG TPA: hypothetical protein VNG71_12695 [Pyrinomonadaceae bacterium]|nr:hypothetical protein [Pyrinomonadaceae bacterium]